MPEQRERLAVDAHVAVPARVHHRVHAVQDGVAGEQDPFLLQEEAQVVRRVTWGVEDLQAPFAALDGVTLADDPVGDDVAVLVAVLAERDDLGPGGLDEPRRPRGVVGVRVGEDHPADAFLHRRADDGVDVGLHVGAGVDHRDLVDPDEVRVRPRPGERSRVRRDDAPHEGRQRARDARREVGHQAVVFRRSGCSSRSGVSPTRSSQPRSR